MADIASITSPFGNGPESLPAAPGTQSAAPAYQPPTDLRMNVSGGSTPAPAAAPSASQTAPAQSGYQPPTDLMNTIGAQMTQPVSNVPDLSKMNSQELMSLANDQYGDEKNWMGLRKPKPGTDDLRDAIGAELAKRNPDQGPLEKMLNIQAGVVRETAAGLVALATQNPEAVKPEDIGKILNGRPPSSVEYLQRMGVPKGASIDIPGVGEVNIRGAAGLAADIASNAPIGVVARLAKESSVIAKLINMPGQASEAVGNALKNSALKSGKAATTAGEMIQNTRDTVEAVSGIRSGLFNKANELGAFVNTGEMGFRNTSRVLEEMKNIPKLQPVTETFEQSINALKQGGPQPLSGLSEFRNSVFNSAYEAEVAKIPQLRTYSERLKSAIASDVAAEIKVTGNAKAPGLGDAINHVDNQFGQLLEALPPQPGVIDRMKKFGSVLDMGLLASGNVTAFAVKKSAEIATSPFARKFYGNALVSGGRSGLATGAVLNSLSTKSGSDEQ